VRLEPIVPAPGPRPGESFRLPVRVTIPAGWHVNSDHPNEDYLIPTRLELEPAPGFELVAVHYPSATELEAGFVTRPLAVFAGGVILEAELRAAPDLAPGDYRLPLVLHYQPCTDRECLPPAEARVEVRVTVRGGE